MAQRGAQIVNRSPGGTPGITLAQALNGQWGYRIKLGDTAKKVAMDPVGPNCVVNGVVVPGGVTPQVFNISTQDAMDANGLSTGAKIDVSTSTVFYVYYCVAGDFASALGFSTTGPARNSEGVYYLNGAGFAPSCLFIGWIYVDASGNLLDSLQNRHIVNYYNRRRTPLYINPGYVNDNAVTSYTRNSATWTTIRATAAEAQCSFVGNGEDAAEFTMNAFLTGAPAGAVGFGIGLSTTQPVVSGSFSANAGNNPSSAVSYRWLPAAGSLIVPQMLTVNSVNNATYVADSGRNGAAADVAGTLLVGSILA